MTVYPHSDAALETIARNVIIKYDPTLLSRPAPIPIEAIMEKVYGLTIEYRYIRKNKRVLGETIFEDTMVAVYEHRNGEGYKLLPMKAGTVIIDPSLMNNKSDGRFHYTCAHELLHYIKHKDYFIRHGETAAKSDMLRKTENAKILERQAERFASYLLMPKGAVKMAFYRLAGTAESKITALATLFKVSEQAMGIRLKEMRLIA